MGLKWLLLSSTTAITGGVAAHLGAVGCSRGDFTCCHHLPGHHLLDHMTGATHSSGPNRSMSSCSDEFYPGHGWTIFSYQIITATSVIYMLCFHFLLIFFFSCKGEFLGVRRPDCWSSTQANCSYRSSTPGVSSTHPAAHSLVC